MPNKESGKKPVGDDVRTGVVDHKGEVTFVGPLKRS